MRLLGLAPGGVCLAATITGRAGGLLHRRFTLTRVERPHRQYASLLHCSVGLPRLAVSQHRTLWRADFPQTRRSESAITRFT